MSLAAEDPLDPSKVPSELRRLGRHELLLPLAAGGMASVYLARKTGTAGFERLVAIKVCHPHLRMEPEFVAMFVDEARLAARLHHPKVVPVLDIVETPVLHLVMEYVRGGSLAALAGLASAEDRPMMLRAVMDTLEGLHAAHTARDAMGEPLEIIHRDVSPHNILVGLDGTARLTDFGVARARERIASTRPGDVKGKLGYMAPEVLLEQRVTVASDVFACGVVLYEMCAMRRLFATGAPGDALGAVDLAPPLAQVCPGIAPGLDAVVRRALSRDPADRFSSAEAMLDALEATREPVASHREVGVWVQERLGPALAEREVALRDARAARDETPDDGSDSSALPEGSPAAQVPPSFPADPGRDADDVAALRRGGRRRALGLGLTIAALGLLLGWIALRAGDPPATTSAPSVSATPPEPIVEVARPAEPTPVASPDSETEPSINSGDAAEPSERPSTRRRRRRRPASMRYRPESI